MTKLLPHLILAAIYGVGAVFLALWFPGEVVVTQQTIGWMVGAIAFLAAALAHEVWARRRNQRAAAERIAAIAGMVRRLRDEPTPRPVSSAETPLPDEDAPDRPSELEMLDKLSARMRGPGAGRTPPPLKPKAGPAASSPPPPPPVIAPIAPIEPIAPIQPAAPAPGLMADRSTDRVAQAFAAAERLSGPGHAGGQGVDRGRGPEEGGFAPEESPAPRRPAPSPGPARDSRYFDPHPPEEDDMIGPAEVDDEAFLIDLIRDAIDNDRVEIHVRDVVTLPQRRPEFLDCVPHVRTQDGKLIPPDLFQPVVEQAGYQTAVANLLLLRLVQQARRGRRRQQTLPFLCPLGRGTLSERTFFVDFVEFLRDNAELAPQVIFGLAQYDLYRLDPRADEELAGLAKIGYRFCLDDVQTLDLFVNDLSQKGFRYVRVGAGLLTQTLDRSGDPRALKRSLDRGAMDLIVTDLATESQVLDILDYAVDFGTGPAFGAARPL